MATALKIADQASELDQLLIRSEGDVVEARHRVREFGRELGFSSIDLALIATAVSEICRNIIQYAGTGTLSFGEERSSRSVGIVIVAEDKGPGIPDISLAMQDGYSTRNSLGMGLPGVKRLMDEFAIESEVGKGTRVVMKKWKS